MLIRLIFLRERMSGQNHDEGGVSFILPADRRHRLAVTAASAASADRTDGRETARDRPRSEGAIDD